jgi:hypothetical protein
MPKPHAKTINALEELIDEYLALQRSRPDLPQGNWIDLSEEELEQIVVAFQPHKSGLAESGCRATSTFPLTTLGLRQ